MKGYKGFDKDLKCRGFQFAVGKTYEEPEASICNRGFHFCEHPLNVFDYYPPATSRFCEVASDCVSEETHGDTKRVTTKLRIGEEINIEGLVKAALEYTFSRSEFEKGTSATGELGAASATGELGAASATGILGAASATGYQGAASATGIRGAALATGEQGAASATGYHSVALACGQDSKARGALGCAICCVERCAADGHILAVKAAIVDGEIVKADTWYTLRSGELVEAN